MWCRGDFPHLGQHSFPRLCRHARERHRAVADPTGSALTTTALSERLRAELGRGTTDLARARQLKDFRVLPRPLEAARGERSDTTTAPGSASRRRGADPVSALQARRPQILSGFCPGPGSSAPLGSRTVLRLEPYGNADVIPFSRATPGPCLFCIHTCGICMSPVVSVHCASVHDGSESAHAKCSECVRTRFLLTHEVWHAIGGTPSTRPVIRWRSRSRRISSHRRGSPDGCAARIQRD